MANRSKKPDWPAWKQAVDTIFNEAQPTAVLDTIIWNLLEFGHTHGQTLLHTPVLLSHTDQAFPAGRYVVLRHIERGVALECHSDARTIKCDELRANPKAAFLFYEPQLKLQITVRGTMSVHSQDDYAKSRWSGMPKHCYLYYQSLALPGSPGTLCEADKTQVPCECFENFSVLRLTVEAMDVLYLRNQQVGNRRFQKSSLTAEWHEIIP